MNTAAFLETLRSRDIQIWPEGGQLRCSAPPGTLDRDLREQLRQRKNEILKFLRAAESLARQQRAIVPLQPNGTRPPVFAVAGHNGDVFTYRTLVRHLGRDQPFFGLQPPGLDGQSRPLQRVEELASYFAEQIVASHPAAPCIIAGYCAGGGIAFELARQLLRSGMQVNFLALFGAPYATAYRLGSQIRLRLEGEWARMARFTRALASSSNGGRVSYLRDKLRLRIRSRENHNHQQEQVPVAAEVMARRIAVQRATFTALSRYKPSHFAGRIVLLLPSKTWAQSSRRPLRWRSMADHCQEYFGPDDCETDVMLLDPYAAIFAELFNQFRAMSTNSGL